jgi:hypothetical protein
VSAPICAQRSPNAGGYCTEPAGHPGEHIARSIGGEVVARWQSALAATVLEACARAAHEVNRAWCLAHGDDSQKSWDEAPEWQKESARDGVLGVRAGSTPEKSHVSWLRDKAERGWKYQSARAARRRAARRARARRALERGRVVTPAPSWMIWTIDVAADFSLHVSRCLRANDNDGRAP